MEAVGARLKPRAPDLKAFRIAPPLVALLAVATPATAAVPSGKPEAPSVQQIRSAAAEYDAGRRAFVDKDYDGAAAHFENAFNDAPSAEALRSAIRAHRKAGHLARAATLAEVAFQRYPKDAATGAIVRETLAESASKLHEVTLQCTPDCGVATDGRAISPSDAAQIIFFLDPGSHDLVVSWSNDRTRTQKLTARAGGRDEIVLEAPPSPNAPPAVVAVQAPTPAVLAPVVPLPGTPALAHVPVDYDARTHTKPFGPWVFIVGAALTAGGIGLVTWSGIDAESHPGTAAVKAECVGALANSSCPAYQQGLSAQLRTNIALGVTGGVALTTAVVGIFFTQWSSPKTRSPLALQPLGGVSREGASLGVAGSF